MVNLFRCEMCGSTVSRRSSFALKALNGKDGRICRNHPAIITLLQEKINEKALRGLIVRFAFSFQFEKLMAGIRLLYVLYGIHPREVLDFLTRSRFDPADVKMVYDELDRIGGAKMSPEQAYFVYSNMITSV